MVTKEEIHKRCYGHIEECNLPEARFEWRWLSKGLGVRTQGNQAEEIERLYESLAYYYQNLDFDRIFQTIIEIRETISGYKEEELEALEEKVSEPWRLMKELRVCENSYNLDGFVTSCERLEELNLMDHKTRFREDRITFACKIESARRSLRSQEPLDKAKAILSEAVETRYATWPAAMIELKDLEGEINEVGLTMILLAVGEAIYIDDFKLAERILANGLDAYPAELNLETIREHIKSDKSNYVRLKQKAHNLHKSGNLEKAYKAAESASDLFPESEACEVLKEKIEQDLTKKRSLYQLIDDKVREYEDAFKLKEFWFALAKAREIQALIKTVSNKRCLLYSEIYKMDNEGRQRIKSTVFRLARYYATGEAVLMWALKKANLR